ncbi:MAG: DUF3298 and DUF4163 domain-containing protein [Eubacteriaceae bacterium]|nr:DUF3298 and DUF4163 domain-containing protein [Eubacteriaceae bacterium]
MDDKLVTVNTLILQDTMKYNGVALLAYRIEYPEFKSVIYRKATAKMNKFYKDKAYEYEKYYRKVLFNMAVEQYKYDMQNGYPVREFDAVVEFNVTYNEFCIVSLYTDEYEYTGGAHGNTIRTSQTWNLKEQRTVKLSELFRIQLGYRIYIFKIISEEIRKDESIYFPDWEKLVIQTFNEESFYVTYEGIVIYYQQYDIAPYSSGIREFLIPYNINVINPKYLCI